MICHLSRTKVVTGYELKLVALNYIWVHQEN